MYFFMPVSLFHLRLNFRYVKKALSITYKNSIGSNLAFGTHSACARPAA